MKKLKEVIDKVLDPDLDPNLDPDLLALKERELLLYILQVLAKRWGA